METSQSVDDITPNGVELVLRRNYFLTPPMIMNTRTWITNLTGWLALCFSIYQSSDKSVLGYPIVTKFTKQISCTWLFQLVWTTLVIKVIAKVSVGNSPNHYWRMCCCNINICCLQIFKDLFNCKLIYLGEFAYLWLVVKLSIIWFTCSHVALEFSYLRVFTPV